MVNINSQWLLSQAAIVISKTKQDIPFYNFVTFKLVSYTYNPWINTFKQLSIPVSVFDKDILTQFYTHYILKLKWNMSS